jgi:3-oxoacyl-[acyl-carrier-protein] synthase III
VLPESSEAPATVTRRRRRRRLRTAGIIGLGAALPIERVTNSELAATLDITSEWILKRTGIGERRRATAGEHVSTLASRAGALALQDAGIGGGELDMILVATLAADEIMPNAAPLVAHALGAGSAAAADIGAACAGFVVALAQASAAIESGRAESALVIGAEIMTRFLDHDDPRTGPLFGDGAGAVVLARDRGASVGATVFGSDGSLAGAIAAARPDGPVRMHGHETFLNAVDRLCACTQEALAVEGLELEDIDLFVYHQANGRILTAVAERLGVPRERVYDCIFSLGNTSAASIPLALTRAVSDGSLQPGARVLLGAVGAGLVWGAATLEWSAT